MSKRFCKICGKELSICKEIMKDNSKYNWRKLACCYEHGQMYFDQLENEPSVEEVSQPEIIKKPKSGADRALSKSKKIKNL